MTIDWLSIAIAAGSAFLTTIYHRWQANQSQQPAQQPQQPNQSGGGLLGLGLLHRLGGNSGNSTLIGHPVLDSIVSVLQGVVQQNPQLLTSLEGVMVQLVHPGGSVNINLSKGDPNAPQPMQPAPQSPASGPAAVLPLNAAITR